MSGIGLALSGGGAKGAFTVGVLKVVRQIFDVTRFPVIAGTSTGSLVGTLLTTNQWTRLVEIYSKVTTPNIVNPHHAFIGSLLGPEGVLFASAIIGGRAIYDTAALRAMIVKNGNFKKVKAAYPSTLLIYTTVDMQTGARVDYTNRDHSQAELIDGLLASASMPVLMDPVDAKIGGKVHQLVDGGVREYLPLQAVFDSGVDVDRIIAVATSPMEAAPGKDRYDKITDILGRTISLLNAEVAENDLRGAHLYNAILRMLENARSTGVLEADLLDGVSDDVREGLEGKRSVPVTLIAPTIDFEAAWGLHGLEFDPKKMKLAMAHGVERAREVLKDV